MVDNSESSSFLQNQFADNHGDNVRIRNDACIDNGLTPRDMIASKPLKFRTTNFFNHGVKSERGVFFNHNFGIPSDRIEHNSELRASKIGRDFNNCSQERLPTLPLPTTGNYMYGQGDVEIEDMSKGNDTRFRKSCNEKEINFNVRTNNIFTNMPFIPNQHWENHVQRDNSLYMGDNSRKKKSYMHNVL